MANPRTLASACRRHMPGPSQARPGLADGLRHWYQSDRIGSGLAPEECLRSGKCGLKLWRRRLSDRLRDGVAPERAVTPQPLACVLHTIRRGRVRSPFHRQVVGRADGCDRATVVIEAIGHQTGTLGGAVRAVADGGRIFYFVGPDDVPSDSTRPRSSCGAADSCAPASAGTRSCQFSAAKPGGRLCMALS
jgi:hypothetical protein